MMYAMSTRTGSVVIKKQANSLEEAIKLCEVKNSGMFITVEKPEWKDSLDSALQYYVNKEEYEECSKIQELIDKL